MSMSRRDYVKFAEILRLSKELDKPDPVNFIEQELASIFAADNPRFNPKRFYAACEPKEEK